MIRLFALFLCMFGFTTEAFAQPSGKCEKPTDGEMVLNNRRNVDMYDAPSSSARATRVWGSGTQAKFLKRDGMWAKVKLPVSGKEGYVSWASVCRDPSAAPPPAKVSPLDLLRSGAPNFGTPSSAEVGKKGAEAETSNPARTTAKASGSASTNVVVKPPPVKKTETPAKVKPAAQKKSVVKEKTPSPPARTTVAVKQKKPDSPKKTTPAPLPQKTVVSTKSEMAKPNGDTHVAIAAKPPAPVPTTAAPDVPAKGNGSYIRTKDGFKPQYRPQAHHSFGFAADGKPYLVEE